MAKARPRKRKAQVVLDDSDLDDERGRPSQKLNLNLLVRSKVSGSNTHTMLVPDNTCGTQNSSKSPQGKQARQQPLTRFTQVRSPVADPISANTPEPRATLCHAQPDPDARKMYEWLC